MLLFAWNLFSNKILVQLITIGVAVIVGYRNARTKYTGTIKYSDSLNVLDSAW